MINLNWLKMHRKNSLHCPYGSVRPGVVSVRLCTTKLQFWSHGNVNKCYHYVIYVFLRELWSVSLHCSVLYLGTRLVRSTPCRFSSYSSKTTVVSNTTHSPFWNPCPGRSEWSGCRLWRWYTLFIFMLLRVRSISDFTCWLLWRPSSSLCWHNILPALLYSNYKQLWVDSCLGREEIPS